MRFADGGALLLESASVMSVSMKPGGDGVAGDVATRKLARAMDLVRPMTPALEAAYLPGVARHAHDAAWALTMRP